MMQTIIPGIRTGNIHIPSSKSMAHRYLISAALSGSDSRIRCAGISKDISATIACLNAMGAEIETNNGIISVKPLKRKTGQSTLLCGESGSTLRFLLPVVGALGLDAVFEMEGRLPGRPMKEYEDVLKAGGMSIERDGNRLQCSGILRSGDYVLPGNISSQYFTGLLFALPLLKGDSRIIIKGCLESADYFELTKAVLIQSGIRWMEHADAIEIPGGQAYAISGDIAVEGDYSSAAFFLCAGAFSHSGICVNNIINSSRQGDRRVSDILESFGAKVKHSDFSVTVSKGELQGTDIDASLIPDLIPVLSIVAAVCEGRTRIYNAGRLRMKESDRLESTAALLKALGAQVRETQDGLVIDGCKRLKGGCTINTYNDHRIAMSAAVAACVCEEPVVIPDAECVAKSYPDFWLDFGSLKTEETI